MILEFDCGNTRVKWRLRDEQYILTKGFFSAAETFNGAQVGSIPLKKVTRVLVGSVLDDVYGRALAVWSREYLNIDPEFAISEYNCSGVVNGYLQPERLGVDRWLAILAGSKRASNGFIVVDCGSAITVDVVASGGEHLGGYIAPGLRLMREALENKTARIEFAHIGYAKSAFPGRNTIEAIKAAELAMVSGLLEQAKLILSNCHVVDAKVYVTGGDGEWLSSLLLNSIFVEDLVLDGLSIALALPGHRGRRL